MFIDTHISQKAANTFLLSKGVKESALYCRTIFNVDTDSDIADMFKCAEHWVKVSNGAVVEWYTEGYTTPEGEEIFGVSRDLESGDPIDEYRLRRHWIEKRDTTGNTTLTLSCFYYELPYEVQKNLIDFPFKDRVINYSKKPYGDIIEYKKMKNLVLIKNNIVENLIVVEYDYPSEMIADYTTVELLEGSINIPKIGDVFVAGAVHQFQPQNPNDGTTYREPFNRYMSDEDYAKDVVFLSI